MVEERTHEPGSNPAEVASSSRIDVHAHCVPQEWQAVPAASAPLFRGLTGWNVPSALEMMDRQGHRGALDGLLERAVRRRR